MAWTIVPETQTRVFHYSDDPNIERFVPHVPATNRESPPFVWAIEARYAPLYWFPRDCPRVAVWANDDLQAARLQARFATQARRLHMIEAARRRALRTARLYEYEFDGADFEPWPDAEGQWVARQTVVPMAMRAVGDLDDRHRDAGVELRDTDDLAQWRADVVASELPFSIVRFATTLPR